MFYKKGVLKYFVKITGKYLCRGLFLNKVSGLLRHRFSYQFCKNFKNTFFIEDLGWLLLSNVTKLKEKKKRTHTQFKNESKTRQNINSKPL